MIPKISDYNESLNTFMLKVYIGYMPFNNYVNSRNIALQKDKCGVYALKQFKTLSLIPFYYAMLTDYMCASSI